MMSCRILSLASARNVTMRCSKLRLSPVDNSLAMFATPVISRGYNKRKTIKIAPTKPLKFYEYCGDIKQTLDPIDPSEPKPGFEGIEELKEAEEEVQKLFSMEYANGRDILKRQIERIVEKTRQHPADVKSYEYVISLLTVLIRNQMKHCTDFRKDKVAKSRLVRRIQARRKLLKILRMLDYEKFEWLLEELQIKYIPYDPNAYYKVGKREKRRQAAEEKTVQAYEKKMEDLKAELTEEYKKFEVVKFQELAKIEEDMKALGLEPQETLEDTINLLKYGTTTPKMPRPLTRRQMILAKKFALKAEKKREGDLYNYQKALANM